MKQPKQIWPAYILLLLAFLSPRLSYAQGYWIYDGQSLTRDERGDPEAAKATGWVVWLYRNGHPTGGHDYWGTIDGASASEVMRKLKDNQAFELRFNKWAGKGAVPDEKDTYFNPLGPIAKVEGQASKSKSPTNVLDSFPISTLTRYKKSFEQVNGYRRGYQQIVRVVSDKPADPNPFAMVGVEVREYSQSLRDASEKLSKLRGILESVDTPQLELFNQQLSELESDVSRLQKSAPAVAQGFGIPADQFAPLAANEQQAAAPEDPNELSAYDRQMKALADELTQASSNIDPNNPDQTMRKIKEVFRKIARLEAAQPNTDPRSKELAELLRSSLDSDDPVQMMQAMSRMMELLPQPQ